MAAIISALLVASVACGSSDVPSQPFHIRMSAINPEQIADVRADIAQLIYADITLAADFLRLGFHDSIGGPDGCVSCLSKSQVIYWQNMGSHIRCLGCTG